MRSRMPWIVGGADKRFNTEGTGEFNTEGTEGTEETMTELMKLNCFFLSSL
jgi:hypothetical protein